VDGLCSIVTMATELFIVGNSGDHGNQVGFDCLCTNATKLFTLGNCGNQVVYFRAETT
jgi:hypothetical protein